MTRAKTQLSRRTSGVALALLAASSFALSGPIAKAMIDSGWTAGAAVTARILIAGAVLIVPALVVLRGRWSLVRRNAGLIVAYSLIAIAGCQLAYFNAVDHMDVGVAILIEFACPVLVIGWMWLRHGQRPSRLTVIGAVLAIAGLMLVLDLISGADLDTIGVLWALGAMAGAAVYWIISADEDNGLPGIVLAAVRAPARRRGAAASPAWSASSRSRPRAPTSSSPARTWPWWLPVLTLGVVTAGLAYVLGIAASRRLGSRLGSFVGLSEAVASVLFAWLLLDQAPRAGAVRRRRADPARRHRRAARRARDRACRGALPQPRLAVS